ncbi:MAG: hypothetical protein AB2L14_01745 [Candidatus Xenobiia bacterium LiM19]
MAGNTKGLIDYILNLIDTLQKGRLPKHRASAVVNILITRLGEIRKTHGNAPRGSRVVTGFFLRSLCLIEESLFKISGYLMHPTKEAISEARRSIGEAGAMLDDIGELIREIDKVTAELPAPGTLSSESGGSASLFSQSE